MVALNPQQFSYRGFHQPTAEGPPLHNLTEPGNFMDGLDVYENPHHFTGTSHPQETYRQIRSVRGKPDAPVNIYRAAPPGVSHINPGDWVTTSRGYARQHGMSEGSGDWPVLHAQVPAKHVRFAGDDLNEHGYFGPEPVPGRTK